MLRSAFLALVITVAAATVAPARTYVYEPAGAVAGCAGAETVTGTAAGSARLAVFDPGVYADPSLGDEVAGSFSLALVRELRVGDTISLAREPGDGVKLQFVRTVGACGVPVEPSPSPSPSPEPTASPSGRRSSTGRAGS